MRRQAKKFAVGGVDGLTWHQATTIPTQFFELFPRQRNFCFFPATAGCLSNCWGPLYFLGRIFLFIVNTRPQKYFWYKAREILLTWGHKNTSEQKISPQLFHIWQLEFKGSNKTERGDKGKIFRRNQNCRRQHCRDLKCCNCCVNRETRRHKKYFEEFKKKKTYTQMKKIATLGLTNHNCIFKGRGAITRPAYSSNNLKED